MRDTRAETPLLHLPSLPFPQEAVELSRGFAMWFLCLIGLASAGCLLSTKDEAVCEAKIRNQKMPWMANKFPSVTKLALIGVWESVKCSKMPPNLRSIKLDNTRWSCSLSECVDRVTPPCDALVAVPSSSEETATTLSFQTEPDFHPKTDSTPSFQTESTPSTSPTELDFQPKTGSTLSFQTETAPTPLPTEPDFLPKTDSTPSFQTESTPPTSTTEADFQLKTGSTLSSQTESTPPTSPTEPDFQLKTGSTLGFQTEPETTPSPTEPDFQPKVVSTLGFQTEPETAPPISPTEPDFQLKTVSTLSFQTEPTPPTSPTRVSNSTPEPAQETTVRSESGESDNSIGLWVGLSVLLLLSVGLCLLVGRLAFVRMQDLEMFREAEFDLRKDLRYEEMQCGLKSSRKHRLFSTGRLQEVLSPSTPLSDQPLRPPRRLTRVDVHEAPKEPAALDLVDELSSPSGHVSQPLHSPDSSDPLGDLTLSPATPARSVGQLLSDSPHISPHPLNEPVKAAEEDDFDRTEPPMEAEEDFHRTEPPVETATEEDFHRTEPAVETASEEDFHRTEPPVETATEEDFHRTEPAVETASEEDFQRTEPPVETAEEDFQRTEPPMETADEDFHQPEPPMATAEKDKPQSTEEDQDKTTEDFQPKGESPEASVQDEEIPPPHSQPVESVSDKPSPEKSLQEEVSQSPPAAEAEKRTKTRRRVTADQLAAQEASKLVGKGPWHHGPYTIRRSRNN